MDSSERPTPRDQDVPGGFPETPSVASIAASSELVVDDEVTKHGDNVEATIPVEEQSRNKEAPALGMSGANNSSSSTILAPQDHRVVAPVEVDRAKSEVTSPLSTKSQSSYSESGGSGTQFAAVRTPSAAKDPENPPVQPTRSHRTEDDVFKTLSRRRSRASGATSPDEDEEEQQEIERLMSRMFGQKRQQQSEQEKTRHSGVIFRGLTVRGIGLGATLQPTVGDFFLGIPRRIVNLFTKGPKAALAKPPVREILSNIDGCVRPGELVLVLGRPGSGCTTFLKTFCNQRAGFEAVEGDVTYGGVDAKTMQKAFRGEIAYHPEDDLHYATLSVKRTLKFALQTRTPGKDSRLEGETRQDYVNEFLRVVTKLVWIEHTLGTKVGNEFIRGVSGGERKRVSIAEAIITRASVQGWDNSSRGLDASTAVEYLRSIRAMTNMANTSTAVALYQAGQTLYELADKVLVLDEGRCVYFGRADDAKQYFIDLGFECPERWTTADFLTSVTDENERSVREGWEDRIPRTAQEFDEAYRRSEAYQRNLQDMQDFEAEQEERVERIRQSQSERTRKKNYEVSFYKQVIACTQRQFLVMTGDPASLFGKWGGLVFQGLIVGSLFFNLPDTSSGAFPRGGTLFFLLLFNALLALAEQTAAFESKPIVMKHKAFSFYRPSAFAIAQTAVDVPLVFIQCFLFNVIIYFMANLARTASQFFITTLILWLTTMITYAFFRTISAWCKTLDVATRFTGVSVQILVVYTGYLIPPDSMRPWFGWLRWINWLQYGFECLMANEFTGLELQCEGQYLVPQIPGYAPPYQGCALAGSMPGNATVDGASYIQSSFTYTRAHLWRNFGFLWAFFIFFVALTALGWELMEPNVGGGAITVFKRGQVPKSVEEEIATGGRAKGAKKDEESGHTAAVIDGESTREKPSNGDTDKQVAKNETVFTFQNLNYTIPYEKGQRKLLQDVEGFVRPGKLTALMGASGAGKTTLLNALAQRLRTGTVTGDFLVDGRELPRSFQRATGFAEQQDIHEPTATVREALQFSALLRQPREVPTQEKMDYVETIIDLLEMSPIAGAIIGKVGEGLNQEQRKRLTIGVELASKPELLLFLDEPTSGLDSGAAYNIVRFLRKLADAGQAVLCTIHQPSAVLFEQFDELLLLKSGGRVVFHGELGHDSQNMLRYFESNGAHKCPPTANPAEYMLEAIGAGDPNYHGQDWGDVWAESKERDARKRQIDDMIAERRNTQSAKSLEDDREYAMPVGVQTWAVVKRSFVAYWRTPNYILGKVMLHILTGLFNCFTFYKIGFSSVDYQNRLFSIFMTLTISPPLIQQLQPVFLQSRQIFEWRENNAKIYSWFAWTTGAILAEIPYAIVCGGLYFNCWFWGIFGWRDSTSSFVSGFSFLLMLLFELFYVSFGQAIASFSPNELLASLLVPLFFLFVVSFCGVVVPYAGLPTFWKDWMYWLTPFHYLLEAWLGAVVHDQPLRCKEGEFALFEVPDNTTCEDYTKPWIKQAGGYAQMGQQGLCELCQYKNGDEWGKSFNVSYSHIWRDFGIFCGFIAFNYAVVYFSTFLRFRGKNPLKALTGKKM